MNYICRLKYYTYLSGLKLDFCATTAYKYLVKNFTYSISSYVHSLAEKIAKVLLKDIQH